MPVQQGMEDGVRGSCALLLILSDGVLLLGCCHSRSPSDMTSRQGRSLEAASC
jgi:hypothetical protein